MRQSDNSYPSHAAVMFICHSGEVYGSQESLRLLVKHLPSALYAAHISFARTGPLQAQLAAECPHVQQHRHARLQWIKHDYRTPWQRLWDVVGLLAALPGRTWDLARQLRGHGIGLVHTNSVVSLEGALAAKLLGLPHVWHIREMFARPQPKLHCVLGAWLTRWAVLALSARVVCVSEAIAAQFPEVHRRRGQVVVLYNAIETLAAQAPPPPLASTATLSPNDTVPVCIGYAGRLSEGKRFQDLIEAVARLRQYLPADVWPRVHVEVAGTFVDDRYPAKVDALLLKNGLKEKFRFLGHVRPLTSCFLRWQVLVLPSWHEPFGRVLVEAMACGLPCVGADSGGIPEIILPPGHPQNAWGKVGCLFPPGDIEALAQLLARLLQTPDYRREIGLAGGRMVAQRFTIEVQIQRLTAHYQTLLAAPATQNPRPTQDKPCV